MQLNPLLVPGLISSLCLQDCVAAVNWRYNVSKANKAYSQSKMLARLTKPRTISHLPRICTGKTSWCQGVRVLCAVTSGGIPAQGEMMCSQLPCRRAQRGLLGCSLFMQVRCLTHSHRSPFRLILNWSLAVEPEVCYLFPCLWQIYGR